MTMQDVVGRGDTALVMRQIISLAQRLKGVIRIRIEYAGVEMTLDRAERLFSN